MTNFSACGHVRVWLAGLAGSFLPGERTMRRKLLCIAVLVSPALLTACAAHSDSNASAGSGGSRASQSSSGRTGGRAGSSNTGFDIGGAVTGFGGSAAITDAINMAAALTSCNPDSVSATECGGVACPALPELASATCTINCCSPEGKCGQRSSAKLVEQSLGTACSATAAPDDRCPASMLLGTNYPGCCDASGRCGQILGTTCFATGTLLCDQAANDAGM